MPETQSIYEDDYQCDEHIDALCGCGLGAGEMQIRRGVLCTRDEHGRLYLRAPRKADVQLARRVVAAVSNTADLSGRLPANVVGLRETK